MADPKKKDDGKNPIQSLVGGILGLPGEALKATGLDQLGTIVVDSLQPDGTLSVSHLLDLGGVRTARTKSREIAGKMEELQAKQAELQVEQEQKQGVFDQINRALGIQGMAPADQQQVAQVGGDIVSRQAGAPAAQEALANTPRGPGVNQREVAMKAGIQAGEQAKGQFLQEVGLTPEAQAQNAGRRQELNSALEARGVKDPASFTQHLPLEDLTKLSVDVARKRIQQEQGAQRSREAFNAGLRAARKGAVDSVTNPGTPGTSFERGILFELEKKIGVTGPDNKKARLPSRSELAAMNEARGIGKMTLDQTGDKAAANAMAHLAINEKLGLPRFSLTSPSKKGYKLADVAVPYAGGSQGIEKKDFQGLIQTIHEHRLRNAALLNAKLPYGIDPGTPVYVQEWQKALSAVPGVTAVLLPDPMDPNNVVLGLDENAPNSLPVEQLLAIQNAILGE